MLRQGHHIKTRVLIAVVRAFLIGCAILLVVGGSGVQAQASKEGQGRSSGAGSEEDRCEATRFIFMLGRGRYTTNDVPGCPHGGLLSGTDQDDSLAGKKGEDEIRGLGDGDEIHGGYGSDVIYGEAGMDFLESGAVNGHDTSKNALYGGDGADMLFGAEGEDVLYGGDGNDYLDGRDEGVKDTQRDKLYCGEGRDQYIAGSTKCPAVARKASSPIPAALP